MRRSAGVAAARGSSATVHTQFILICVVIGLFALIGLLLFSRTGFYDADPLQNFNNYGHAALCMLVLYSSENFPMVRSVSLRYCSAHGFSVAQVMYDAYDAAVTYSHAYVIFFVVFLLIALFGLANVVIPILYNEFREHRRELALSM